MKDELNRCLACPRPQCTGCPAGTDVARAIKLVKTGNIDEAGRILFDNNPLSAITSLICPSHLFCKKSCVLDKVGRGVNFAKIEAQVSAHYITHLLNSAGFASGTGGTEAKSRTVQATDSSPISPDLQVPQTSRVLPIPDANPAAQSHLVIGGGPAGMAFAILARRMGHNVTLFERQEKLGGMLRYGIPDNRLDKTLIDKLETYIKHIGINIVNRMPPTGDFNHVVVATGARRSRKLGIPGEEYAIGGIEFLDSANKGRAAVPETVTIIGGGNVAVDCAIAAATLGARVTVRYRRGPENLRAYPREIQHARELGVVFEFHHTPTEIRDDGTLTIIAIGQEKTPLEIEGAHYIGDCKNGPGTVIEAVKSAKDLLAYLTHSQPGVTPLQAIDRS